MPPISKRGWVLLSFGFIVALSPALWEPFLAEYPVDGFFVGLIFYAWSILPFFTLAVLAQGLKMGWPSFLIAAGLATGATVFMQVDLLLYPGGGAADGLAFIFLPIWLAIAVPPATRLTSATPSWPSSWPDRSRTGWMTCRPRR
jgi:hypothetical protein